MIIGIIVSGHGNFATGVTSAVKLLAGEPEQYVAIDFLPEYSADQLKGKMQEAVEGLKECGSVLILTDLTGGTPYNVASKLRMESLTSGNGPQVEVIGGVNLGGVIEAAMTRQMESDLGKLAAAVARAAKGQIVRFRTEEETAKDQAERAARAATPAKVIRKANPDGPQGEIVHARVDERLIHGQVAMVWTNTVGATRILVANDEALKDEMVLSGLKMAKPAGVKLSVATVSRAAKRLKENAYPGERVFVITKNVADMAELVRQGVKIGKVNVGNVAKREGSRNIKKSVNLTDQDIADIKDMISRGHEVTAQMIPNESDQSILNYIG